jgi:hypothetical protein
MGPKLGAITKGGVLVTGTVVGTTGNNSEPIGPNDADLLNEGVPRLGDQFCVPASGVGGASALFDLSPDISFDP